MKIIADFHIHSKYSRATSPQMNIENLIKWAKIKGINLLGTGDFTHPAWFSELKEKLEPIGNGLFKPKNVQFKQTEQLNSFNKRNDLTYFVLTSEISCIYSRNNQVYKIHLLVFAPSFEIVAEINKKLGDIGNLYADGRPILGLDAKELVKIVLDISKDCFIVPAHIWTPWFSLFGANSGFNSLQECFEELSPYIRAIETGLSSDPAMNWRISELDQIGIISCSDSHSPSKIGRESCFLETDLDYKSVCDALSGRKPDKLLYTVEFFPEEGKYHFTGHRNCNVVRSPQDTKKRGDLCSECGKKLTVGTMYRVEELSDRPEGYVPENSPSFKSLVPLEEIIAEIEEKQTGTKTVLDEYLKLINLFQNEFNILLEEPIENIEKVNSKVSDSIKRVREGKVNISPGYDGVYGKVSIWKEGEKKTKEKQISMFE